MTLQLISGVVVGVVVAVVGAVVSHLLIRNRERERWEREERKERDRQDHERNLQEAEVEDRQQSQLRDERHKAYTAFTAACDRLHEGDYSPEAMAEFRKTRALVWLVAPSTDVQEAAQEISNFVLVRQPQQELRGDGEENRRKIDAAYGAVLRRLLDTAQRDLGIDPAAIQDPA